MPKFRRRFGRKFGRRGKRRMIKRYLRKRARKGNATFVKLKLAPFNVTSDAGGVVNTYNTITNPSSAIDWSSYGNLYDSFRVFAYKIQFIPSRINELVATTAYVPFYTAVDYDSINASGIASISDIISYENMKVYNLNRPFKRYIRVPKYSMYQTSGGTNPSVIGNQGWMDFSALPDNGVILLYGTGMTATTTYGQCVVTFYVGFRNRR